MARRKRGSEEPALKPVPTEILDQFVDAGCSRPKTSL